MTVWITNSNPASLTMPGRRGQRPALTFPQGSTNVQTFQAICTAPGTANLTCGASDGALANAATVQVDTPLPPALVAHWTFDDPANPYAETSGYQAAGTHDGQPQGTVATSTDIPPGTTGNSLDLTQGGSLQIANTRSGDAGYQPTFDEVLVSQMTIAFWVKITQQMGDWDPFIVKNGEGRGFQVRLHGCNCPRLLHRARTGRIGRRRRWRERSMMGSGITSPPSATALTGLRMMYVDGYPDQPSVRPTSDTGLMLLASGDSLYLGPAAGSGRQFNGYLKDVRIYNYRADPRPGAGAAAQRSYADGRPLDLRRLGPAGRIAPATNPPAPTTCSPSAR